MKRQIKYEDLKEMNGEPIGMVGGPIPDFLPSPAELAGDEKTIKVTLALSKRSVDYFKASAGRYHSSYQRMIRRLVDDYAARRAAAPSMIRESRPPVYKVKR